ncbi:Iron-sulfur protein NUBPL [Frankliniella fusca]|uniref:Iron-sulfur protein NUBPL n=1 Tax=Frankliniella fusca TaxID=407009 RepID=A0AAE1LQ42_9NEOP|nr:Iron-sulfur protein NUBPL [Frankliniella fusca]
MSCRQLVQRTISGARATAVYHDADDYRDPLAQAVMDCSDMMSPVISEQAGALYAHLARECCEDAALLLEDGRSEVAAEASASKCFSRTLLPRAARATADRLVNCVRSVLAGSE